MSKLASIAALLVSALLALASVGAAVVAAGTQSDADGAVRDALRLYAARLEVAKAERALGDSDLEDAIRSAGEANAIASKVGRLTGEIVATLGPAEKTAGATVALAKRGARGAITTRRQTEVATRILGAISGYQRAASRSNADTNRALRRILKALRKTNEEFGP